MRHKHLKISWSALLRAEECKRQNYLVLKGHRSKFMDRRNFIQGTVVDLAMREFLERSGDEDLPEGALVEMVKAQFLRAVRNEDEEKGYIKWKGNPRDDQQRVIQNCVRAAKRLEPWLRENILPYDYQPEARGVALIGVPDENDEAQRVELFFATDILVRRAEDDWVIYDLKVTENEDYTKGKTLAQLTFYAIALAARLGIPVSHFKKLAFVTPLLKEIEQTVYPDRDDFRYMMTRITAYAQSMWVGDYAPKDSPDSECTYRCPVRRLCPLFSSADSPTLSLTTAASRKGPVSAELDA